MRREEEIVAGDAIACGELVLVPLLRIRAHAFTGWAGVGEGDAIGFVVCAGDAMPRLIALDQSMPDAASWSAWLADRPALLASIRDAIARLR